MNKKEFKNFGACLKCKERRDLNDFLYCEDCASFNYSTPIQIVDLYTSEVLWEGTGAIDSEIELGKILNSGREATLKFKS